MIESIVVISLALLDIYLLEEGLACAITSGKKD